MKYQFVLPPAVRKITEWQIEHFPEEKKQLEAMKNDMILLRTQDYEHISGSQRGFSRPTERNAIQILSVPYIRRMEIGVDACERVLARLDDRDMELLRTIFWKKSRNVTGAAMDIFLSRSQAYKRLNTILGGVAFELGYLKGE